MPNYDWSAFTQRVPVRAAIQQLYDAWATQAGLECWFLRKAEFTQPDKTVRDGKSHVQQGDAYEWLWHGWSDDVVERGTVLEANGKDFFKFSFGKAGIVSVTIKTELGISLVELAQAGIPTDEDSKAYFHVGYTKGWVFYLTNLKSIFEGGIDLRNRDVNLKNVITA
ncbi:MAG: SRPBCC domain-containing protein [Ignavibacteriales bacterium]|nr:SRPBCC domain-containing protein [Ignavibacteriales bacterium]MBI3787062.1 SRPBCC domain-containing protein [Ignavibacteriales bacterium]